MIQSKFQFNRVGALAALLLIAAAPMARAQLWLDSAYPSRPMLGPSKASGAVIWSHGRSVDSEDSQAPIPPYMATLRDGGWDTFRFNRMRVSDSLSASAKGLADEVHRLKQQGYRQVAVAGQSFGAFLSFMAADSSDEVDAVIATAPAAYGSFSDFYDSWRSNASRLYPLIEEVRRARVMVFYFHGDDFDPGGRGERSRDILEAHGIPHVVIDQPPLLTTHWAAASQQFARVFGGCILGFLDATQVAAGARCDGDTFWAGATDVVPLQPAAATATTQGTATQHVERH